jgi:hypothetical protein
VTGEGKWDYRSRHLTGTPLQSTTEYDSSPDRELGSISQLKVVSSLVGKIRRNPPSLLSGLCCPVVACQSCFLDLRLVMKLQMLA